MTQTFEGPVPDGPRPGEGSAPVLRPEVPALTEEIVEAVRVAIPEYAAVPRTILRRGVECALMSLIDPAFRDEGARTARSLGVLAARREPTLDRLHAAYRLGGRITWRRVMDLTTERDLPAAEVTRLATAVLTQLDELATCATHGFLAVRAHQDTATRQARAHLLRLILDGDAVPEGMLARSADAAGWARPPEVTPVAVEPGTADPGPLLDSDVLADFSGPEPVLLIPGRFGPGRRAMLETALPGARAAIGFTVPRARAASSLRVAQDALGLAAGGLLGDDRHTVCEDHPVTLWLSGGPAPPGRPARTADRRTETLRAWLAARGTMAEVAETLGVSPRTARERHGMDRVLRDHLTREDAREGIEDGLRSLSLDDLTPDEARPTDPAADGDDPAADGDDPAAGGGAVEEPHDRGC